MSASAPAQSNPEADLQVLDDAADGRQTHLQFGLGRGEAAATSDCAKNAQTAKVAVAELDAEPSRAVPHGFESMAAILMSRVLRVRSVQVGRCKICTTSRATAGGAWFASI